MQTDASSLTLYQQLTEAQAKTGFGGGKVIDGRRILETNSLSTKIGLYFLQHSPLRKLFEWQVNRTHEFFDELMKYKKKSFGSSKT